MKKYLFFFILLISAQCFSQKNWQVKFYAEKTADGYSIFADNDELTPLSVTFSFTLKNMRSSLKSGELAIIPAQSRHIEVASLTVINRNISYSYQYKNQYNFGDVSQTTYDQDYIYDLPYEKDKKVLVYQGYNGTFSHQNQLALDFQLAEGSKLYAAREGKVVEMVENNSQHCSEKDCAKFNNKITVMHPDGTFADYLHLQQNGAVVALGDQVTKGQFIGYSGNTGWSNGPHLHFSVFLNRMDGNRVFLKTKFRTGTNSSEILAEKKWYTKP